MFYNILKKKELKNPYNVLKYKIQVRDIFSKRVALHWLFIKVEHVSKSKWDKK